MSILSISCKNNILSGFHIDANTEAIKENTKAKVKNSEATTAQAIANEGEVATEKQQRNANLQGAVSEEIDEKATKKNTIETLKNAAADNIATRAEQAQSAANAISSGIRNIGSSIAATAKTIGIFLLTDPIGWLLLATAAIAGLAAAIYKHNHRLDESIEKHKELLETQKEGLKVIQEEIDKTNEQTKSLSDLCDQYKKAVEGSSEYYELANKIAELDTSLVIGYTSNGDAILADTNKIEDQIEAYKELNKEKLQEKKNQAKDIVDTSATLVNENKLKKQQLDDEISELEERRKEEQANVDRLISEGYTGTDVLDAAENAVGYYEGRISEIKSSQEYKDAIDGINDAQKELSENIVFLFDDIPEGISEEKLKTEKAIRQFAIDIASASEEALDANAFLNLFEHLKTDDISKQISSLFELKEEDIPFEEYQEKAEEIYKAIIDALASNEFELDEKGQLALQVALKIDEESQRDYINARNRFAQELGVSGVNSRRVQSWYDKLNADEIELVEKNVDKLSQKIKFVSADNLVTTLDESLEYLKGINKEVETLKEFTLQDMSESVTSKLASIESLYNSFNSDIVNGEKTRLDIDDVEGLRSSLVASEDNPLGVTSEQFEEFERIVADGTHSVEEMQDAFDKLSTEFVDAALAINGYTDANKNLIKAQLEDAGYTKESVDAYVEYKSALLGIQEIANNTDFDFNTKNGIEEINKLADAANNSSLAIQQYAAEILLSSNYKDEAFDSSASIANLQALKTACGGTAPVIDLLIQLMNTYQRLQVAISSGQTQMINGLQAEADRLQAEIQKAITVELEPVQLNTKATQDAGKEAADEYVEAFEKELKELDDLRDAGVLGEKDYLNRLQALYIKYFANRKEYIKEFAKYEKQYLEGMQNLYNAAISAAITLLNDEKEDIEKAKDDALDALDDAKQNEIDPINDHIKALENERDALQKERDALQEANDEREREMNLQKAQYELERANKQRTRLIYKNGQMSYVNDLTEVRNAKKNVEDAIFDKKVAAFDKQISNLDDQIDNLNKQLDEIDERYQQLIDDTEKFYDEQVKGVQDLIDMWEKLQHQADLVEAYEALNNFGISAQDILSGNIDVFNQIRDGYIGTFAGLHQDIDAVSQAFGTNVENAQALKDAILGYDDATATFAQLKNDINNIGNSASDAASKIGNETEETSEGTLTGNLNKVGEAVNIVKEVSDALNGSENSLKNAVEDVGNTAEEVVPRVKTLFESLRDSIVDSVSVLGNMPNVLKNAIDDAITGTGYHKTVDGGAGLNGTAYADGKWTAGSKGISGKSLVGELGAEIRVRDGRFEVLGSNGAEFADIRKDDIIFNHKQSQELLKNGHINSRGKAYASGNANKFTALSSEELSKYNKLDFTKDLAEKLDFGNQKLMNIDKMVSNISTTKTVNSNPVFNIDNTFTCNGVSLADIQNELAKSFQGIFEAAYQKAMTK